MGLNGTFKGDYFGISCIYCNDAAIMVVLSAVLVSRPVASCNLLV